MATIKLDDFAYFLVFLIGSWNTVHGIHQNERLVKAYQAHKKKTFKKAF